jgi:hypothetical protein
MLCANFVKAEIRAPDQTESSPDGEQNVKRRKFSDLFRKSDVVLLHRIAHPGE